MIQYGYMHPSGEIVWVTARHLAENICKATGRTMYERDVSEPRVSSIRA